MRRSRDDALARCWFDLIERRLPAAGATRPDWPVRLDHCFARILLDNACGGAWRAVVAPPAWANLSEDRLRVAVGLGDAVLAGDADLAFLHRRSLRWRGKAHRSVGPCSTASGMAYPRRPVSADLFGRETR